MNIQVIKSRRRTIGIEVHADGKVIVRTPLRMSSAEINRFIEEHDEWIRQKLDFVRQKSDNRRGTGAPGVECLSKQELDNIKDTFEKRVQFYCDMMNVSVGRITIRIDRLSQCLPPDWGDGYDNVTICCTMENQDRVDYRLPLYKAAPVKHKIIICEPLLSAINFKGELGTWVEQIVVGGESGKEARICNYDWVLDIRRQCIENNISFWFKQTGYRLLKGEREYKIARQFQHTQARKAGINYSGKSNGNNYSD